MKFLFFRKALKFQTKYFFHKLEGLQMWDIDSFGYGPQPSDYTEKKIWKLFLTWVLRNLYYQWTEQGWLGDRSSPPAMQWNDVWHCKAIQTQGPWKIHITNWFCTSWLKSTADFREDKSFQKFLPTLSHGRLRKKYKTWTS